MKKSIIFIMACLCLIGSGCVSEDISQVEKQETQVENIVRQYYNSRINGDYENASNLLVFNDATENMKMMFPESFSNTPIQSYTIERIEALTPELYEVKVIGVYLTPVEFIYENGEIVGSKSESDRNWHVDCFESTIYTAYIDGKWGICLSARYVPEEMYEFPEDSLMGGEILNMVE